jgi:predicted nuclease with TOPRIM domain
LLRKHLEEKLKSCEEQLNKKERMEYIFNLEAQLEEAHEKITTLSRQNFELGCKLKEIARKKPLKKRFPTQLNLTLGP